MSKKGGKSTPSKGEKGDKTRTTPTNELVPGILDNEEHFSKYRGSESSELQIQLKTFSGSGIF